MTTADIDRLAAFCRLSERGYEKDKYINCWHPEWRPDLSDDDCRMVIDECFQLGVLEQVVEELYMAYHRKLGRTPIAQWLLLATPAEKCKAMLRVLKVQPKESTDG